MKLEMKAGLHLFVFVTIACVMGGALGWALLGMGSLRGDERLYDCAFERLTPPSGYVVTERQVLADTTYVIVLYRGRHKAFQRDQMIQCEEVPDG